MRFCRRTIACEFPCCSCVALMIEFGLSSTCIQLHPSGTHLLIGQKGGTAYLISNKQGMKGVLEKKYCVKNDDGPEGYTAIFATMGQAVVNGSSNGCALVWDRKKGTMVYGLKHEKGTVLFGENAGIT